ncbi:hypothetical protein FACS189459_1970 [Bacilli bacterium]|nr:hypothetical protein FACS189459_1970 [Bacilli bacterium]
MKKAIILIYPSTRTRHLIKEVRELGYTPVVIPFSKYDKSLDSFVDETFINQLNAAVKSEKYTKYKPDIIEFDKDMNYQKMVDLIKNKYDVLAVIPCSDPTLRIGDFFQKAFKLKSNAQE